MTIKIPLVILSLFLIAACGGSDQDISVESEFELKQPSNESDFLNSSDYVDNLDLSGSLEGLEVFESKEASSECAAAFSFARNIYLNRIEWTALVKNPEALPKGEVEIILRFYGDNGAVTGVRAPRSEFYYDGFIVKAQRTLLSQNEVGDVYHFWYEDYMMFSESAGNYWVSIAEPVNSNLGFSLLESKERQDYSRIACRSATDGLWYEPADPNDLDADLVPSIRLLGGRKL